MLSVISLYVPSGSFELFSNFNGTVKDDFSEFDNLRTSKKPGTYRWFLTFCAFDHLVDFRNNMLFYLLRYLTGPIVCLHINKNSERKFRK